MWKMLREQSLAAINGCWTGLVNVVNDEPLRDESLVDRRP